jgi:hypothetical protein
MTISAPDKASWLQAPLTKWVQVGEFMNERDCGDLEAVEVKRGEFKMGEFMADEVGMRDGEWIWDASDPDETVGSWPGDLWPGDL